MRLLIILLLTGCTATAPDITQSTKPNWGLIDACLLDEMSSAPTIARDPMCKEAVAAWHLRLNK
jgi:hypothetical protein